MEPVLHPLTKQITDLLSSKSFWFETFTHDPVLTSEEAAKTRPGYTLQQGAKAIITKNQKRGSEEEFVMFVIPANLRLSSKKIKKSLDLKGLRFATEEEIGSLTNGVQRGAIPPLGNLFHITVYVDLQLYDNEKIVFNAGDRRFSVAMKSAEYNALVQPTMLDIVDN